MTEQEFMVLAAVIQRAPVTLAEQIVLERILAEIDPRQKPPAAENPTG